MNEEEEGFLNRWSRRKQEAAKEPAEEAAKPEEQDTAAGQADATKEPAEEEFDVSTLPPIESITAGTDIRAFLSKGVPAALTQAALRRAWSADPAIRDYIGLSEYSWDFNAPGQYGFGTLDPSVNVQEMVADVFGKVKKATAEAETLLEKADPAALQTQTAQVPSEPPSSVELRSKDAATVDHGDFDPAHTDEESGDKSAQAAAAPQQSESDSELPVSPVRRHGSALPN